MFTIASYNIFLGAGLLPIYWAKSAPAMAQAMADAHAGMRRTDIEGRAEAIAELLRRHEPAVIGLQEVALWERLDEAGRVREVDDFLVVVRAALERRGLRYQVAAMSGNSRLAVATPQGDTIAFTDRVALLVRDGRAEVRLVPGSARAQVFARTLHIPTEVPGISFTKLRGWAAAEVALGSGRRIQVATTHLEAYEEETRAAQCREFLAVLAESPSPAVVFGDFNAAPGDGGAEGPYQQFQAAGYLDAWTRARGGEDGFTGEQAESLNNSPSRLFHRVDHCFYLPSGPEVRSAELVGASPEDRSPTGLWPSDHAGLVVTFG